MLNISASVYAEKPQKDIHSFVGTFTRVNCRSTNYMYCQTEAQTTIRQKSCDIGSGYPFFLNQGLLIKGLTYVQDLTQVLFN